MQFYSTLSSPWSKKCFPPLQEKSESPPRRPIFYPPPAAHHRAQVCRATPDPPPLSLMRGRSKLSARDFFRSFRVREFEVGRAQEWGRGRNCNHPLSAAIKKALSLDRRSRKGRKGGEMKRIFPPLLRPLRRDCKIPFLEAPEVAYEWELGVRATAEKKKEISIAPSFVYCARKFLRRRRRRKKEVLQPSVSHILRQYFFAEEEKKETPPDWEVESRE